MDRTEDWGLTNYEDAYQIQLDYVHERIEGTRTDTLVFTEHYPVFTLGRRKDAEQNLIWDSALCEQNGIQQIQSNRGGDVTYHAPGQIVIYPIIQLKEKDLDLYLRRLETITINTLQCLGLAAHRNPKANRTGIWLENRKIAAIGVAAKRWVTYHGLAINVNLDLTPFSGIVPCGIPTTEAGVSSIAKQLGTTIDPEEVKQIFVREFWQIFS